MRKISIFFLSLFIGLASVHAQSAEKFSEVLNSEKVTYAQASYFFASALGAIDDSQTEAQAYKILKTRNIIAKDKSADDYITLKELSWLCVQVWDIKGSFMLKLCPGPRYAFKQMKADGIFTYNDDPSKIPDGHKFFNIITDCLEMYGEN